MRKTPQPDTGVSTPEILAAIRAERLRQGLTYTAAAAPIGMHDANWCGIESGKRIASEAVLQQMAERLGLKLTFELRATISNPALEAEQAAAEKAAKAAKKRAAKRPAKRKRSAAKSA